MGLEVILRRFGGGNRGRGDRIIGIIVDSSLLLGLAVSRPAFLRRSKAWAGLGGGLGLSSSTVGRGGRGGRGIGTAVGISTVGARALGRKLGNSGTGEFVGSVGEGVDEDTGITVTVGTGESDELIRTGGSGLAAADVDLDAAGVELGTSGLVGQMKGDDLVTDEISTASEVGRELERMGLSVDWKNSVRIVDQK